MKHYPHVLAGPQSKRHIDVCKINLPVGWSEVSPKYWAYQKTYAWIGEANGIK